MADQQYFIKGIFQMKKIIKQEMREFNDEIYELTHFEEIVEHEDEEITRTTFRIIRAPYRNQEVEITDDTKSLINKIAKRCAK